MSILRFTFVTCLFASIGASAQEAPPATPEVPPSMVTVMALQDRLVTIARENAPSIVTIRAFAKDPDAGEAVAGPQASGWVESAISPDYPGFRLSSAGSGYFVTDEGDILTCAHHLLLPDGRVADLIVVETPDQKSVISEVVAVEPTVNLAVVRLQVYQKGYGPKFKKATIADRDALDTGTLIVGMGDPSGPEKYFAFGTIISAPSRDCYQDLLSSFYIQAGLIAPPEAYGGPVLDMQGKVIGMLSPRDPKPGGNKEVRPNGIELALPSSIIMNLYTAMKEKPTFRSPWLGFSVMSRAELIKAKGLDAFNAMPKPRNGILIENIFKPSPASDAGIVPGDFLVSFNGELIHTPIDFQRCLYLAGIDSKITLEIFHEGEVKKVGLTILVRPADAMPR